MEEPYGYCKAVRLPCEGALATFLKSGYKFQLCVQASGVRNADVGTYHLFSLVDPFGKYMCSYSRHVRTLPHAYWGQKHVLVGVQAKGDNAIDLSCPGSLVRVRQGYDVLNLCLHAAGWQYHELLRQFMVRSEPECALVSYILPFVEDEVYYRDEL